MVETKQWRAMDKVGQRWAVFACAAILVLGLPLYALMVELEQIPGFVRWLLSVMVISVSLEMWLRWLIKRHPSGAAEPATHGGRSGGERPGE